MWQLEILKMIVEGVENPAAGTDGEAEAATSSTCRCLRPDQRKLKLSTKAYRRKPNLSNYLIMRFL